MFENVHAAARPAKPNGISSTSPMRASGPSVIKSKRSARYNASSMSCVTITTIVRGFSQTSSNVSCRSSLVNESNRSRMRLDVE